MPLPRTVHSHHTVSDRLRFASRPRRDLQGAGRCPPPTLRERPPPGGAAPVRGGGPGDRRKPCRPGSGPSQARGRGKPSAAFLERVPMEMPWAQLPPARGRSALGTASGPTPVPAMTRHPCWGRRVLTLGSCHACSVPASSMR